MNASNTSIGIRADEFGYRSRVITLTDDNYRVWSTLIEQVLREKKLWSHVARATLPPPHVRVVTAAMITVAATPGSHAVAGVAAIT